eukprot:s2120_g18.t1
MRRMDVNIDGASACTTLQLWLKLFTLDAMDPLPQLPEHEVVVVNTFLQVKEKRPDFGRAGTAPALRHTRTLDLEEETPAGANDGDDAEATGQETEEAPDEDSSNKRQPAQKKPSWQRLNTPDLWEQQLMMEQVASGKRPPAQKKPSWQRINTPDLWEQQLMMEGQLTADKRIVVEGYPATATAEAPAPAPVAPACGPGPQVPQVPSVSAPAVTQEMRYVGVPFMVVPSDAQNVPLQQQLPQPEQGSDAALPQEQHGQPHGQGQPPTLLGRTASPRPDDRKSTPAKQRQTPEPPEPLAPGAVECTASANGGQRIRWCVDGHKLESHAEKLISPEFELKVGRETQPFRLMVLATETGGRHGSGFKKAKGRCFLEMKCLGSLEGAPTTSMLVTAGTGSRKQKGREVVKHSFAEKNCCSLPKGQDSVWDLKASLCKETKSIDICVEILPYPG